MFINNLLGTIKRYFISGMLVVVPLILTYIVLKFLFQSIDGILQPLIIKLLGYHVVGLGILVTVLLIILAGIITRNYFGAKLLKLGEYFLVRMPVIRPIYSAAKQLIEALTVPTMEAFKDVVLIEYPRKGVYAMGFKSNIISISSDSIPVELISVFIPSTPTPVSGMVVMFNPSEVHLLEMTVEEGIKFLVSGGVVSPALLKSKKLNNDNKDIEVDRETR